MMRNWALVAIAFALAFSGLASFIDYTTEATNENIRVDGGLVSGTTVDGVRSFKGIPFAAPPVGDLRWKPPQPVVAWQGVRQADNFGPICPQSPYPSGSMYYSPPQAQSEDCLSLNVWTAARVGDKRPVMVWIHGGALTRGSGSNAAYDGTALAKKGVILVTINYRIGPLGYLAHSELTSESPQHSSGNYGVLDQIAALKWVLKNIATVGGDPKRVTIFGESAGSWSVNTLVASPLAKGLFLRAIGESGGAFPHDAYLREDRNKLPAAEKVGAAFAKAAGADSIKALRAMPAEKIVDIFNNDPEGRKFRTQVNVDGWVLPDEISKIFAQRKHNDVPAIVGSNLNEMTTLTTPAMIPKTLADYRERVEPQYGERVKQFDAVYPVKSAEDIKDAYLGSLRDTIFSLPMRTWARMTTGGRSKAYLYLFSHVRPGPNSKYIGAYHASEILYVFGNLNPNNKLLQDADFRLSEMMTSYWVNFAITGDPNGTGLAKWAPYDQNTEPYLDFGDPIQLRNHLLKEQLDFLEEFQRSSSAAN